MQTHGYIRIIKKIKTLFFYDLLFLSVSISDSQPFEISIRRSYDLNILRCYMGSKHWRASYSDCLLNIEWSDPWLIEGVSTKSRTVKSSADKLMIASRLVWGRSDVADHHPMVLLSQNGDNSLPMTPLFLNKHWLMVDGFFVHRHLFIHCDCEETVFSLTLHVSSDIMQLRFCGSWAHLIEIGIERTLATYMYGKDSVTEQQLTVIEKKLRKDKKIFSNFLTHLHILQALHDKNY